MKELDRESPMRAIHRKTGEIGHVEKVNESKALTVGKGLDQYQTYFDCCGNPKDDFCPWRVENVPDAVDWSKPLQCVSGGIIRDAYVSERYAGEGNEHLISVQIRRGNEVWCNKATGQCGEYGHIRNTQNYTEAVIALGGQHSSAPNETATLVDKALWERVVRLIRDMAGWPTASTPPIRFELEARAIAELLRPVVDEDLIEAREVAASMYDNGRNELLASNVRKGLRDDGMDVSIALAAIARGRALERGE